MKIPLFSAFWCLLRAIENFALAAAAVAMPPPLLKPCAMPKATSSPSPRS